jgi:hypothetical protein
LGKPKKNPAFQGGIAPPGSCCLFILLQMPERIDIKISIQKLFVSGATQPNIWDAGKQRNRSYLRRERKEFSTGNRGKAGNTTSGDPVETGGGNGDICPCDMGEEGRETLGQRGVPQPGVNLEGSGFATLDANHSDRAEGGEARADVFLDRSGTGAWVPKISVSRPAIPSAEPTSPWSGVVRVELLEEFGKESLVLCMDGQEPQATK